MKTNLSSCCNAEVEYNAWDIRCSKCNEPCDLASPEVIELKDRPDDEQIVLSIGQLREIISIAVDMAVEKYGVKKEDLLKALKN